MNPFSIFIFFQCLPLITVAFKGRIVGGQSAERGDFPHQVALKYNGKFLCGGSIIDTFLVLTAAHCVVSQDWPNIFDFEVIAGLHNKSALSGNEQIRFIKYIYDHENYNNKTLENDIAIIVLSESLKFTPYVWKIDLPEENEDFDGYATVSGWGKTEENSGQSEVLKKLVVPIVPIHICRANYQRKGYTVNDTALCIGDFGRDSCEGDSGSAAIYERTDSTVVQCGIVSYGHGCGLYGFPGIYTKVSSYVSWINILEKTIVTDEKNGHLVIREIRKGNLTNAIVMFAKFNRDPLLRGIIIGAYEKLEGITNFLNILGFIKNLPTCDQQKIAFPVLHEVFIRNGDKNTSKILMFDESLTVCMNSTNLKTDVHKLALHFLATWISRVQHGENLSEIIEFAKEYNSTFSTFIDDIMIGIFSNESVRNSSYNEIAMNTLDFIDMIPYCKQDKIALQIFLDVTRKKMTDSQASYFLKINRRCVNVSDKIPPTRVPAFATSWASTIRLGGNLTEIQEIIKKDDFFAWTSLETSCWTHT